MRALTLSQPWATLHVAPCSLTDNVPAKRIESRSWRALVNLESWALEPVAIHAGKWIDKDLRDRVSNRKHFVEPYASMLRACGFSALDAWRPDYWDKLTHIQPGDRQYFSLEEGAYLNPLPLGEIIGAVTYYDCVPGIEVVNMVDRGELCAHELELGDYRGADRWGFLSRDPILFAKTIPCRGYQQFWRVPHDVEAQVRGELTITAAR